VALQGASSSTAATGDGGRHEAASAATVFAARPSRSRFSDTPIDGDHFGAGSGELRRLAARRGAKVDDSFVAWRLPGLRAEQPGRQAGGQVLDPPGALRVAGKLGDVALAGRQPQAAGGQDLGLEGPRPVLGRRGVLEGEIEGRFRKMRLGDGLGGLRAVGRCEGVPQPVRRVEAGRLARRLLFRDPRPQLAVGPAQDRVDQALVASEAGLRREPHRGVDRGMGRRPEEQDLAEAQAQNLAQGFQLRLQRPLEQSRQSGVELAQAAQAGGHQMAREGTVAGLQP
jgi:hypothetical protein